jgi:hypothetical protein
LRDFVEQVMDIWEKGSVISSAHARWLGDLPGALQVPTLSTTGRSFLHNSSSRKENRNEWNKPKFVLLGRNHSQQDKGITLHMNELVYAACHGTTSWCVRPPVVAAWRWI